MSGLVGMDIDAVKGIGGQLQSQSDHIDSLIAAVNSIVTHLGQSWSGTDAQEFQGWWEQQHRPALHKVSLDVRGLGQSALNNASAQETASSAGSSSGGGAGVIGVAAGAAGAVAAAGRGGAGAAPGTPAPTAPAGPAVGQVGATSGQLPPSGGRAAYENTVHVGVKGYDQWGKVKDQCTSWAGYRRAEFGLGVPYGHGGAMATDVHGAPTLGGMVSWGSGIQPDYGHVMIVEQVMGPDEFRVSEMNYDAKGTGSFREDTVWHRQADGSWHTDNYGANKTLKFSP